MCLESMDFLFLTSQPLSLEAPSTLRRNIIICVRASPSSSLDRSSDIPLPTRLKASYNENVTLSQRIAQNTLSELHVQKQKSM